MKMQKFLTTIGAYTESTDFEHFKSSWVFSKYAPDHKVNK